MTEYELPEPWELFPVYQALRTYVQRKHCLNKNHRLFPPHSKQDTTLNTIYPLAHIIYSSKV